MFAKSFQSGENGVEIFTPSGSEPLKHMMLKNESHITKSYDRNIKGNCIELGASSSGTSISCPRSTGKSLGIFQPLFCLQLYIQKEKAFSLECVVSDTNDRRHRFHYSTSFREWDANELHARIAWPRESEDNWTTFVIDLESFCHQCFRTSFRSLDHFTIHSSCRMRKVFSLPGHLHVDPFIIPAAFDFPLGVAADLFMVSVPERAVKIGGTGKKLAPGKDSKVPSQRGETLTVNGKQVRPALHVGKDAKTQLAQNPSTTSIAAKNREDLPMPSSRAVTLPIVRELGPSTTDDKRKDIQEQKEYKGFRDYSGVDNSEIDDVDHKGYARAEHKGDAVVLTDGLGLESDRKLVSSTHFPEMAPSERKYSSPEESDSGEGAEDIFEVEPGEEFTGHASTRHNHTDNEVTEDLLSADEQSENDAVVVGDDEMHFIEFVHGNDLNHKFSGDYVADTRHSESGSAATQGHQSDGYIGENDEAMQHVPVPSYRSTERQFHDESAQLREVQHFEDTQDEHEELENNRSDVEDFKGHQSDRDDGESDEDIQYMHALSSRSAKNQLPDERVQHREVQDNEEVEENQEEKEELEEAEPVDEAVLESIDTWESNIEGLVENVNDPSQVSEILDRVHSACTTLRKLESQYWLEYGRHEYEATIGVFSFIENV